VLIDLLAAGDTRGELLTDALAVAEAIEDAETRAETLSQLIAYRAVEDRKAVARAVLDLLLPE
jgi:hypothetical protein